MRHPSWRTWAECTTLNRLGIMSPDRHSRGQGEAVEAASADNVISEVRWDDIPPEAVRDLEVVAHDDPADLAGHLAIEADGTAVRGRHSQMVPRPQHRKGHGTTRAAGGGE